MYFLMSSSLLENSLPYFSQLKAPAFILNLASWTQRLFDTRSLLELFIHETMVFLHLCLQTVVISGAYYTSNKYFWGLFQTPPWRPGVYRSPAFNPENTIYDKIFKLRFESVAWGKISLS